MKKALAKAWAVMRDGSCIAVFGTRGPARAYAGRHRGRVIRVAMFEIYTE